MSLFSRKTNESPIDIPEYRFSIQGYYAIAVGTGTFIGLGIWEYLILFLVAFVLAGNDRVLKFVIRKRWFMMKSILVFVGGLVGSLGGRFDVGVLIFIGVMLVFIPIVIFRRYENQTLEEIMKMNEFGKGVD